MTREYFLDEVNDWYSLLGFCADNESTICEDIIDGDYLDECIYEDMNCGDFSWRELRDLLSDIDTGGDFYIHNGLLNFEIADDSYFEAYKEDVCDEIDNWGGWDTIEDEEDNEPGGWVREEEESGFDDSDFDAAALYSACNSEFHTITAAAK